MQYTIEARELTTEHAQRPSAEGETERITVEAGTPDDAISQFLVRNRSQLVSFSRPGKGRESIATVKRDETVFLVRIYEN